MFFSTVFDSPVTIDSSTVVLPFKILPSVGILSPERTIKRSPSWTSCKGISSSPCSVIRLTVSGNSSAIFFKASPALEIAFISIQWPKSIITIRVANSQKKSITWA